MPGDEVNHSEGGLGGYGRVPSLWRLPRQCVGWLLRVEESEGQRWSRGCWSNLGELGDRPGPGQVPGNRVLGGIGLG